MCHLETCLSRGPACRWNPAVEQQAQDRIHRLGQFKPIHVTRFIIAGTIEERILKLQVRPLMSCQTAGQLLQYGFSNFHVGGVIPLAATRIAKAHLCNMHIYCPHGWEAAKR